MKHRSSLHLARGLRIHALACALCLLAFVLVSLVVNEPLWVWFIAVGWVVGLLSHWLSVRGRLADSGAGVAHSEGH